MQSPAVPAPKPATEPPVAAPVEAPIRAQLADAPAPSHVSAADDDVIGQMLLGAPASSSDPQQDRQLQDMLAPPAGAKAAAAARPEPRRATAVTQPAHQQSEPPPPAPVVPVRVKAPEIPVVCKLCGTRMYARPEQIGTKVRCPDCHTENVVPELHAPAAKSRPAATQNPDDDIALSDPGQRPAYRPMVEARGEYAALKYLDPNAPPRREGEAPQQPRARSTDVTMTLSQTATDEDEDGQEVVLSAPVERIDVKEVVKLPEPDDPDDDNQYRGTFRDEEWGFVASPSDKDAWKKSPFYYGILSFPFYPQTALRLVLYSFLLSVDLALFLGAILLSHGMSPMLYAALGLTVMSSVWSVLMLGGALPSLVAITQDTANGNDAVESWPDWNVAEWLMQALLIPAAAFLAALPGTLISSGLLTLGSNGILLSPYPLLLSELIFFPIFFGSMLAEGSFMPVSGAILKSLTRRGEGWLLFYLASMMLGIILAASMALFELGVQLRTILVAPFSAVLWVLGMILYFRLLGRLLWYVQSYRRERDRPE